MMNSGRMEFFPFFDPKHNGKPIGWGLKWGIAVGMGTVYMLLQYLVLPDKEIFFRDYCWILGLIIIAETASVYVATHLFRSTLAEINELEMEEVVVRGIIRSWLSDRNFLLCGLGLALVSSSVGYALGVPPDMHFTFLSIFMTYFGFLLSGFAAGLGMLVIVAVIVLYLNLAPTLQHSLDPSNPDGIGGIKKLGDALWVFAALIFTVGCVIALYMFSVPWSNLTSDFVQTAFLLWLSFPFVLAISVVLIPGLAVRRHVTYYKSYKEQQLKREKARLYTAYRKFADTDDEAIISEKKALSAKMNRIQEELEKLKQMRNSHIDG